MKTNYVEHPHPVIPGTKVLALVPEYDKMHEQEYQDSLRKESESPYQSGETMFGLYGPADESASGPDGDKLESVYVLFSPMRGYWQLINSQTYERWTDALLLGPYVSEGDLHLLTDNNPDMRLI